MYFRGFCSNIKSFKSYIGTVAEIKSEAEDMEVKVERRICSDSLSAM